MMCALAQVYILCACMHTNICGVYVCLHSHARVYSDESVSFCMVEKFNFAEHFATFHVSCIVLMFI